jgi:DNA-binding MarR family transcriptional regulator
VTKLTNEEGLNLKINYATLIWHRLNRIEKKYTQSTEKKLNEFELSEPIADILGRIYDSPGITQNELSVKLLVTKGNIAQLVKKMENCELIYREQNGRTKHLYLTDEGEKTYLKLLDFLQSWIDDFLEVLDKDEQKTLLQLLSKVDRARTFKE